MLRAAEIAQCTEAAMDQLRKTLEGFPQERFVRAVLAPVLANKASVSVQTDETN